jgi:hypothetical protein
LRQVNVGASFDLSQLTSFAHHAGSSALTLTYDGNPAQSGLLWNFTDTHFTYELFGLKDGTAGDLNSGWMESGMTWGTAPGNVTTDGTSFNPALATDLGSATIPLEPAAGAALTFSSAALNSFLNADTNGLVTLMVARVTPPQNGANGYQDFASKENTSFTAPTLNVVAAPLPSTVAGVGSLGFLLVIFSGLRRRWLRRGLSNRDARRGHGFTVAIAGQL